MSTRIIVLLMVFGAGAVSCNAVNLVGNPGFEIDEVTYGNISTYGDWSWDRSEIVGASLGVSPFEGSQMLQFLGTNAQGASPTGNACEVIQLIDISAYHDLVIQGDAVAVGSVYFNRIPGDLQTDTSLYAKIQAYSGSPSSFSNGTPLALAASGILSDGDVATWEKVSLKLTLPSNTDYIAIMLCAGEDIYNDGVFPEFDGHFADNARLEIVPEPATMFLFGFGALELFRRKRK